MSELTMLEQNARRAKEANSFSDYREGSATAEYNSYCKEADEIAQAAKARLEKAHAPEDRSEKVDYLLARYKEKTLSWLNDLYVNRGRVPSILISGGSNFPVRAKEKQNAREDTLMRQNPEYLLDEIKGIGYNAKTIYSDEKDAVSRIKEKIAMLEAAPRDEWGYNKVEIRRLKERLFKLAPEEFADQQKNISVNGARTFDEILALWANGRNHKSVYSPEDNHWYYDLSLDFTDGKRHYTGFVSIEVDESGENLRNYNCQKKQVEFIPLTNERKYSLIICQVSGSGNKAVIYQYLHGLSPVVVEKKAAEAEKQESGEAEEVTINGEVAQIVRNKEYMRLQLMFDGKPSDETRETLKSNGFRWAPSVKAWQRLLNENSEYALRRIYDKAN